MYVFQARLSVFAPLFMTNNGTGRSLAGKIRWRPLVITLLYRLCKWGNYMWGVGYLDWTVG